MGCLKTLWGCVDMIVDRFGATPLVMQLPFGSESQFRGIIDLITMRSIIWDEETLGAKFHEEDIDHFFVLSLRYSDYSVSDL